MKLTLKDIIKSYEAIKKLAVEEFHKGNLQQSLYYIDQATVLAQQFNWIYSDNELEYLLSEISNKIINTPTRYTPEINRVVIFDDYCRSFVLVLQYIKALVASSVEILYITGKDFTNDRLGYALNTIKEFPNLKVEIIPQDKNILNRIRLIHEKVCDFQPSKLFLHLTAKSVFIPTLYSLPKEITKYIINLADQTFWLGSKGIDYSLEFRQFGATVSFEKRELKKEQLLSVPFYPIADNTPFAGFPEVTKGKVVIFSGGDFYKTINPQNTYWNLVKSILDENPNVVFLMATKVENRGAKDFLNDFIEKNNFENRFIYLGFRSDINEVFKHCDIYMGTCPASGSLMSQLAAINAKPILQFYLPDTPDDETEAALCHNRNINISFTQKDKFLEEAKKLINNAEYRRTRGSEIKSAMFTEEQFNERIYQLLLGKTIPAVPAPLSVDYDALTLRWYWIEFTGFIETIQFVYSVFGIQRLRKMLPGIWLKYIYGRYFQTKIFSWDWYKYKFGKKKMKF